MTGNPLRLARLNVVHWPFRSWLPRRVNEPVPQGPEPTAKSDLAAPDLLELLRWHIDRYDRLRASTSTRASVLLGASSVLLTGVIFLINYRLQILRNSPTDYLDIIFAIVAALAVILILSAVTNCINAIATRKTTRSIHAGEIPRRFLFNWGDTLRAVDGYTSFADEVRSLDYDSITGHAIAELWTDIMQHARRHRYLRIGINLFRYSIFSFLILTGLTLLAVA
jgi:hypothetical protein